MAGHPARIHLTRKPASCQHLYCLKGRGPGQNRRYERQKRAVRSRWPPDFPGQSILVQSLRALSLLRPRSDELNRKHREMPEGARDHQGQIARGALSPIAADRDFLLLGLETDFEYEARAWFMRSSARRPADMLDPFKLFGRLLLALLRVGAFTIVFVAQVAWFLIYRRPDKIGDAMGWYGREVVDTFSSVIRR
jgi:hypothetical protein